MSYDADRDEHEVVVYGHGTTGMHTSPHGLRAAIDEAMRRERETGRG